MLILLQNCVVMLIFLHCASFQPASSMKFLYLRSLQHL